MKKLKLPVKKINSINLDNLYYDKEGYLQEGLGLIKEHVVCLRPAHKSHYPQIYAEFKQNKIISHNYGHAGEGFSILFPAVDLSIKNFMNLASDFGFKYDDEITIIGLGCIGLMTTVKLIEKGFTNLKIIGESFDKIPSEWAGGLIELFGIHEGVENIEKLNNFFEQTYLEYKNIIKIKKYFKNSVREIDFYFDEYNETIGLGYLHRKGVLDIQKVNLHIVKDGKTSNEFHLFHCKTIHVVTKPFLNEMIEIIKDNNIKIENHKKVNSFSEVSSKYIFNCTGLGSYYLNNDKDMYPICGHGINLNKECLANYNYIICMNKLKDLEETDIDGLFYFMPKESGFIGGTYLENYDGKNNIYNKEMVTKIIERAKYVFYNLKPINKIKSIKNNINPKF